MPFRTLPVAAGLCVLLAGCGSQNAALIPRDDADRLSGLVAEAGDASAAGDCAAARRAVREAEQQLPGLPRKTDKDLKGNLRAWLDHLDSQIATECKAKETPTPSPTETPAPTETPTPTPSPTETPAPTETPTPTPTPTPTVDPGTGGEQGPTEPGGTGGVPPGEQ
jgi:outer membrane biosynthesis protein TonB